MTTPGINDIIASLITPEVSETIRGQLAGIEGAIKGGLAHDSEFHSLQSWPSGASRYHLVYNDDSAVLFRDGVLFGVAKFDRKLLSKKHPEKKFSLPFPSALAEGAL
jgi:hypothetical protein